MTDSKKGRCPKCCPDGGAYFDREYDVDLGRDVWVCRNCWDRTPVRTRTKTTPTDVSPAQRRTIDRIVSEAVARGGDRPDAVPVDYEEKLSERGDVMVSFRLSFPDLPETAFGNVFPDFFFFFVGRNGGAYSYRKHSERSRKVRRLPVRYASEARV